MNVKKENMPPPTIDEIQANTQGEVRRILEKILDAPDLQNGDHITVAIEKLETRRKAFLEVFNYFTPIVESIKMHERNSEVKLIDAAEIYLNDLKRGCPPEQMNALTDKCVSFAFLSKNGNQITKNFMIVYALLPSWRSFERLLFTLRTEISQCIIMSKDAKRTLEYVLTGGFAGHEKDDLETLHEPPKPPVRDSAKEAADTELLKQQMKTGRVDRKLIHIPRPTILKPTSVRTLLAPIAAQMTDYPVFADGIRISFDVWNGYKCRACQK